jgi:hypothetical protein
MSFQAFPYTFPTGTFIDTNTGRPTQDWWRFLLSLFNRTGAGDGIGPHVSGALTAQGGSQTTALTLGSDWNNVQNVPAGTGVVIPPLKPGLDIWVFNGAAASVNVYPFSGAAIDQLGLNAPFVLAQNRLRCFQCWTTTQLFSYGN